MGGTGALEDDLVSVIWVFMDIFMGMRLNATTLSITPQIGLDEMKAIRGTGSAHLQENDGLEIEFACRHGDEIVLKAERCRLFLQPSKSMFGLVGCARQASGIFYCTSDCSTLGAVDGREPSAGEQ